MDRSSGNGEYVAVTDREFRSAKVLFEKDDPPAFTEINSRIEHVVKPLAREIWRLDLEIGEGTQIVHYQPGGHYKAHADALSDQETRYFAVLVYLNDDFEGGGTSFPYLGNYTVHPRQGKAVLFPARYLHCAAQVTSGEKFVAITFLHGPPAIKWL